MFITVAICTWNRSNLLNQTLKAMCNLIIPDNVDWELVIVNNNSTDDTENIIAKHTSKLPIRKVFEPKQGLSNARNAAVAAARGEYIIWTDDDVIVDKDWLSAYVEAFVRYPDVVFFGGVVDPWFEGIQPRWLIDSWDYVKSAYAVRNLGFVSFDFSFDVLPYGANFSVKTIDQRLFLFDASLGICADKILLGEETSVMKQMIVTGRTGKWVPGAKVRHWIPKSRQTLSYICKYFIGVGIMLEAQSQKQSLNFKFYITQLLLIAKLIYSVLIVNNKKIIKNIIQISINIGRLKSSVQKLW